MAQPKTLVITGYGINSDNELAYCFTLAGAPAERVHINDLIEGKKKLDEYQIVAFPGGFSFGDHIASGRVFANKIKGRLGDQILGAMERHCPIIGICNGFQVLVKLGLLPSDATKEKPALKQNCSLVQNDSGKFEDRWVTLKANSQSHCIWTKGLETIEMPVRHGEGRFIVDQSETLRKLWGHGQVALQYCAPDGGEAQYPFNPNGSVDGIAGICDPSGYVFGLMPHPEAFLNATNHPRWQELGLRGEGAGMKIFRNVVKHLG